MKARETIVLIAMLAGGVLASAQTELRIEPANRTLTVSAQGEVSVDADVAILHIGFETQPTDAKTAYATGAQTSTAIIAALKQAGIADSAIHSEWQRLDSAGGKPHKFTLAEQWTVRTTPERAAEILDIAVTAGATDSGEINWTVENVHAQQDQALDQAAARARAESAALAQSMGVRLGALIYVTNQITAPETNVRMFNALAPSSSGNQGPALAIESHRVTSSANVYAVYAIE
jgi:uncharacterized protein YggE